jgi:hypothetical protein
VPAEVLEGLMQALDDSISTINRKNKREKFCFETSEDAVTWTLFRWLESGGRLGSVAISAGLSEPSGSPSLLLWGGGVSGTEVVCVHENYLAVSNALKEPADRKTEIDMILAWPELLICIEAKHRSLNERPSKKKPFNAYVAGAPFRATEREIENVNLYQLTRNWSLGTRLARELRRRLLLVNLGPAAIGRDAAFARLLDQTSARRFAFVSWGTLLETAQRQGPLPAWLQRFRAIPQGHRSRRHTGLMIPSDRQGRQPIMGRLHGADR